MKGAKGKRGSQTARYWERYRKLAPRYFWDDETRLGDIVLASAKGSLLVDVDGREYIDLTSQWSTNNLGNVHPEVYRATVDTLERYGFLIYFLHPHVPMIELAERLLEIRPSANLTRVFLELSGTGASEAAVKHAIQSSGRPMILGFTGQYHGLSIGALAVGSLGARWRQHLEAFSGGAVHAPYPYLYRRPRKMTEEEYGDWCLEYLEDRILRHLVHPDRIAGVIFEPVALEAGVWIPPANFVRGLKKLSEEHGWFFIVDEVEAGLGRCGTMWSIEHFGVSPDLMSVGKALGGGLMPISAVLGDDRAMGAGEVVAGTTFGGHPAACVAAKVAIDVMVRERIPERSRRLGAESLKRAKEWEELRIVGDVRGLGLAIGVEIVKRDARHSRDVELAHAIFNDCLKHGVIPLYDTDENVLRIQPPLTIEEDLLERALDTMESSLRRNVRR